MPRRRVFFSFNYDQDIWRASNVRKAGQFDAAARAGWTDGSLWEEAKGKGDSAIRRLIDSQIEGTQVTAVLIGSDTANRRWVTYEIQRSIEQGNGVLGIRVHSIKGQNGKRDRRGRVPRLLTEGGYRTHEWRPASLGRWVENAAIDAGIPCITHKRPKCFMCRWMSWW
jgi:hypothetical protein